MCCSSLRLCVGLVRVVDYTVTEDTITDKMVRFHGHALHDSRRLWYTQFRKNQDRDSREDAPACFGRPPSDTPRHNSQVHGYGDDERTVCLSDEEVREREPR